MEETNEHPLEKTKEHQCYICDERAIFAYVRVVKCKLYDLDNNKETKDFIDGVIEEVDYEVTQYLCGKHKPEL